MEPAATAFSPCQAADQRNRRHAAQHVITAHQIHGIIRGRAWAFPSSGLRPLAHTCMVGCSVSITSTLSQQAPPRHAPTLLPEGIMVHRTTQLPSSASRTCLPAAAGPAPLCLPSTPTRVRTARAITVQRPAKGGHRPRPTQPIVRAARHGDDGARLSVRRTGGIYVQCHAGNGQQAKSTASTRHSLQVMTQFPIIGIRYRFTPAQGR